MFSITARQLSACTFLFAVHAAYPEDVYIALLIFSCFITSLIIHRPREHFTINVSIVDYIDPVLAKIWGLCAVQKAISFHNIKLLLCIVGIVMCSELRKKYPFNSPIRNCYHCSLHFLSVVGTLFHYYR